MRARSKPSTPERTRAWPLAWLAMSAALTWSVVRFELLIVAVLTACAGLLAAVVASRHRLELAGRWRVPAVLVGVALVDELVPSFTYAAPGPHRAILSLLAATALVAAAAWAAGDRWRRYLPAIALVGYLVAGAWIIRADPSPRIDVWVSLQQASDGLAHGANAYAMTWQHSYGVTDTFAYLPWTLVLLAPGRWLFGDVRWALMAWTLVAAAAMLALGRWRNRTAWATAALLLLMPGTTTQVEQAWTEPLLLALVALWALLVSRDRAWWAVLPLALALASKQHIVLLLPLLALWPRFGWRRTAAAVGLAAALVAPWVIASPGDFRHDTVTALLHFWPIRTANTLYLAAIHELHRTPPFWLTGLVVLAVVGVSAAAIRRRRPDLAEVLRWCALVLFVANLVNKQAFYNQFWLVAGLVLLSVAVPDGPGSLPGEGGEVAEPALGEGRLGDAQHAGESRLGGGVR
jgi:Glycosyltransferase family 87